MRTLLSVLAVLLCTAGFASAPAQAQTAPRAAHTARTVLPTDGHYAGKDFLNQPITFTLDGDTIKNFKVDGSLLGGWDAQLSAHVSNGAWPATCDHGYCIKGHWESDTHVVGGWRFPRWRDDEGVGTDHWTHFEATAPARLRPHTGSYLGTDHFENTIHLAFNGSQAHGFTVNGIGTFPTVHVTPQGVIPESCGADQWCFKGHWQDANHVVGSWQHGRHGTWQPWEAHAYSS